MPDQPSNTTEPSAEELRYPVGRFSRRETLSPDQRAELIEEIATLPGRMRGAVSGLGPEQLDTPYRPGGWTVRQVVHHVADSHVNGHVRFRRALTEDVPAIEVYDQTEWAELEDARTMLPDVSLGLLDGVHERWTVLLESLGGRAWGRHVRHPEWGEIDLATLLQVYAWHGRHHVAHVTALREREGWS